MMVMSTCSAQAKTETKAMKAATVDEEEFRVHDAGAIINRYYYFDFYYAFARSSLSQSNANDDKRTAENSKNRDCLNLATKKENRQNNKSCVVNGSESIRACIKMRNLRTRRSATRFAENERDRKL